MNIDEAIDEILASWDDWEAEAGQEAQIHQDGGAHVDHMRQRLKGVIGLVVGDDPKPDADRRPDGIRADGRCGECGRYRGGP